MRFRNADERGRRRRREALTGWSTDARLAAESEILRLEGPLPWHARAWAAGEGRTWDNYWGHGQVGHVDFPSAHEVLMNTGVIYPEFRRISRYLINRLIVGDYDHDEATALWRAWEESAPRRDRQYVREVLLEDPEQHAMDPEDAYMNLAWWLADWWVDEASSGDLDFLLGEPGFCEAEPLELVTPASVRAPRKRRNPESHDQRRRRLEREAALGDPEAAARLQAEQSRGGAESPVQAAFQSWHAARRAARDADDWSMARDALHAYRRARFYGDQPAPENALDLQRGSLVPQDSAARMGEDLVRALVLDVPQAEAVISAAAAAGVQLVDRGTRWARRPTVAQATQIVRAYYQSLGYVDIGQQGASRARASNTMVGPDQRQRVVFSRSTLRREVRSAGARAWVRDPQRDPYGDQVGVIELAELLLRRALRATDWRINPEHRGDEQVRRGGKIDAWRRGFAVPPDRDFQAKILDDDEYWNWSAEWDDEYGPAVVAMRIGERPDYFTLAYRTNRKGQWRPADTVQAPRGPHTHQAWLDPVLQEQVADLYAAVLSMPPKGPIDPPPRWGAAPPHEAPPP